MYRATAEDVILNGFPLFHVAGSFVYGLSILLAGGQIVLPMMLGLRNTYMDAPGLPSFQFMTAGREDCPRTSGLSLRHKPLSLMGFAGWLLNRFVALEVLRSFWASPTPV